MSSSTIRTKQQPIRRAERSDRRPFAQSTVASPQAASVAGREAESEYGTASGTPVPAPVRSTPPATAFADGGFATLANGSRVAFGKGAVSENGDIVVPGKGGKPARMIPATSIVRVESRDGRSTWRKPRSESSETAAQDATRGSPSSSNPGSRSAPQHRPQVTKADVQDAFRGQRVEERPDGSFRVHLENGKVLTVRRVDDIGKLSREAAERSVGRKLKEEEWADFRVRGAWTITSSDGRRIDTYGLIRLVNGEADSATLRHEMLHAARSLGLITRAEWQALVKKYAPGSKSDGDAEERIAKAFAAWRGPEGLWQRFTSAINRVLSSLGVVNPSADTALARLREGKVWSREARPETNAEARERMAGDVRYSGGLPNDDSVAAGIPALNDNGLLPPGIHRATMADLEATFGYNAQRRKLLGNFQKMLADAEASGLPVKKIFVAGSFTSSKLRPGDFDVILVLEKPRSVIIQPDQRKLLDETFVKKTYGGDSFVYVDGDSALAERIKYFSQKDGMPRGIIELPFSK
jgi:hypothetical protein